MWKHLVTWCQFFRTRSDENKWWPQPFDPRFLSGLKLSETRLISHYWFFRRDDDHTVSNHDFLAAFDFSGYQHCSRSQNFFSRGCQGHQWVWHQRRHSLFACDMKKGRFLHVPAAFMKLLNKLLSYGVFTSTFDVHPTNFRPIFDQVSTSFRSVFDSLSIGFRTISTTPLRRTMTTRTMFVTVLNEAYFISMPYFALYQTNM